jgi:hypothetical protein
MELDLHEKMAKHKEMRMRLQTICKREERNQLFTQFFPLFGLFIFIPLYCISYHLLKLSNKYQTEVEHVHELSVAICRSSQFSELGCLRMIMHCPGFRILIFFINYLVRLVENPGEARSEMKRKK